MQLGAFSISLTVKNLTASRTFYEKLGFEVTGGDPAMKYLILMNGTTVIGLFEGMFEKNILTFNPGWDQNAEKVEPFTDVRSLQEELKARGIVLDSEADSATTGPGSITLTDPDGNPILIDQHR